MRIVNPKRRHAPTERVDVAYFPLSGGEDLEAPALLIKPGALLFSKNYEPGVALGYRRVDGFERFDGRPAPSDASYWVLGFDVGTAAFSVGEIATGGTSTATGEVLAVNLTSGSWAGGDAAGSLILFNVSGTYQNNEAITSAGGAATVNGTASQRGATNDTDDETWLSAAIAATRADIQAVPGSGSILGVIKHNDVAYAWRNNAAGTASIMHKSSAAGWIAVPMPYEIGYGSTYTAPADGDAIEGLTTGATGYVRRTVTRTGVWGSTAVGNLVVDTVVQSYLASSSDTSATVTMALDISTGYVTWPGNTLVAGNAIVFSTTGALFTGLTAGTTYYVLPNIVPPLLFGSFQVSATVGGAAVILSGTQSGVHTATIATVTMTIATPAVMTWMNHGFTAGEKLSFSTTGALPAGIIAGHIYTVSATGLATDVFSVYDDDQYTLVATSGTQSGVHTGHQAALSDFIATENIGSRVTGLVGFSGLDPAPLLVSWPGNTLKAGNKIEFSMQTGSLPYGMGAGPFYVLPFAGFDDGTFNISATYPGAPVTASSGATGGIPIATIGTVTMTIASPCVITWTNHGLAVGDPVSFTTTGALPTGITPGPVYYVISAGLTTSTIQVSATAGGAAINATGSQSGVHSGHLVFVTATSVAQVALLPSGRYEFVSYNFTGDESESRIYGCDGVNTAFEFDGDYYVPLHTGMDDDAPSHISAHKKHLFLSFKSSLQHSSIGNPYMWSAITGATEINTGDDITGFVTVSGGLLAVLNRNSTYVLYGSSSVDWNFKLHAEDSGAIEWSIQSIGTPRYIDDRGMTSLSAVQDYGDFKSSTFSQRIQTLLDSKLAASSIVSSLRVRSKDQYRVFFADGTGIIAKFRGNAVEFTSVEYGHVIRCACSSEDSTGKEVLMFGADDGYVYEMDSGTSFDGSAVEAYLKLPFGHLKSPQQIKNYFKAVLEMDAPPGTELEFTQEYDYGNAGTPRGITQDMIVSDGGGSWGISAWSDFVWGGQASGTAEAYLSGSGVNVGITIRSNLTNESPHAINGVILHYAKRGRSR